MLECHIEWFSCWIPPNEHFQPSCYCIHNGTIMFAYGMHEIHLLIYEYKMVERKILGFEKIIKKTKSTQISRKFQPNKRPIEGKNHIRNFIMLKMCFCIVNWSQFLWFSLPISFEGAFEFMMIVQSHCIRWICGFVPRNNPWKCFWNCGFRATRNPKQGNY